MSVPVTTRIGISRVSAREASSRDVVSPEARECQIENDQVWKSLLDMLERIDAIFNRDHGIAGHSEGRAIHFSKAAIILDDQDHFPRRREHERMVKEFLPSQKLSISGRTIHSSRRAPRSAGCSL